MIKAVSFKGEGTFHTKKSTFEEPKYFKRPTLGEIDKKVLDGVMQNSSVDSLERATSFDDGSVRYLFNEGTSVTVRGSRMEIRNNRKGLIPKIKLAGLELSQHNMDDSAYTKYMETLDFLKRFRTLVEPFVKVAHK